MVVARLGERGATLCERPLRAAVRTEKRASARHNILVLTLKHGIVFEPDEAALKRELPDGIELIRVRVIPPHSGLQDVWYAVKRQSHAALVPYSALIRTENEDETAAEEGSSSGTSSEGVVTPSSSSSSLWLSGLPDGCNESDVRALVEANASADDATITMPECGGFAQIGPLRPLSLQCLLDALDGFVWRGSTLLALRGDEAAEKLRVHPAYQIGAAAIVHRQAFYQFCRLEGSARPPIRPSGGCSIRRPACAQTCALDAGARECGEWRTNDWCEVRFSAKEFGAQQLRRMLGVLVAVVRGTEGDDYLKRCLSPKQRVATPLAPAEATWLVSMTLEDKEAAGYIGPAAASTGENDEEEDGAAKIRAAIIAAATEPYREFVELLDGGGSTRAADDARLRAAAATGDALALERLLEDGVARCDGSDEYGRSPLFLAAYEGHLHAVITLLEHGARVSQAAHGGWMPKQAALAAGHTSIAIRLEEAGIGCVHAKKLPVLWQTPALTTAGSASTSSTTTPRLTALLPLEMSGHPGAGTYTIDDCLPPEGVDAILQVWRSLPTAPKDKPSPIDRSYYADVDGWLAKAIDEALERTGLLQRCSGKGTATQPLIRFLHYPSEGGSLPPHVDLPARHRRSAHDAHLSTLPDRLRGRR